MNQKHPIKSKTQRRRAMNQKHQLESKTQTRRSKMNASQTMMRLSLMVIAVVTLLIPLQVMAAGTLSGTTITNSATLDYIVGTTPQSQLTSNVTTFVVDNRVDLTVTEVSGATVIPNSDDWVLVFTVTNTGNTPQGYSLATIAGVNGTADDFDMTGVEIYLDVDNDGVLDIPGDTPYALGTRVADIAPDASIQILVVADTPATASDGQTALYHLIATTLDAGTTTITANDTGIADDPAAVEVVWGDAAGTADAATDGQHSADAVYTVSTATLAVTKTQAVVSDPFNGTSNPKAIPDATIRYTITVANSGTIDATDIVIVDATPANTTYVVGSIIVDGAGRTDINDADGSDYGATNAGSVTATIPVVAAGGSAVVTFDVTID
jgi:uncharacterized repeat protein (TIGR01451 family)